MKADDSDGTVQSSGERRLQRNAGAAATAT
jgi:hypothetical protein